jgi:hypothetical protein
LQHFTSVYSIKKYRQQMAFLHSKFIIKNLGNKFHKTLDTSNAKLIKFGFLKERNLQTLWVCYQNAEANIGA